MLQARVLVHLVGAGVDGERRRLSRAQDLDHALTQLDLAGGEVWVDRAFEASAHDAGDAYHVLTAHVDVVVDDALHDAGVIAHIDERELRPVLTPARDPTANADGPADVFHAELARHVRAHAGCTHAVASFTACITAWVTSEMTLLRGTSR